ncbi:MAG: AAA family ATPase, partial [Mangrovicoccus sp.]|nr:AAA family ATPase [Mangrovicoccus sp.]
MTTPLAGTRHYRTAGASFVGRDEAIGGLTSFLFDAARRRTGLVFLSGLPGSGKSALAEHVLAHRPTKDWVVAFKFDQYLTAAPARFFVAALGTIGNNIVALDEPERTTLCRRLVDAVSPNGQILLDLCPALEPVLGAQPAPIELGPLENQIRLSLVLRRFFQALTASGRRLFLFIDDLQWADGATMRVLGDLVVDPQIVGLTVIVASRQGQDDNPRKLRRALHVLGNPTLDLNLAGLSPAAIGELIGKRAALPAEAKASLAERIGAATDGNPLAVVNVISLMMEQGVIRRAEDGSGDQVWAEAAQGLLGNSAVDVLMRSRLAALDPATQEVLGVAANVGDTFDAALITELTGTAAGLLQGAFETLLHEDILVAAAGGGGAAAADRRSLRFAHDKLQEAARGLWDDVHGDPIRVHLAAARAFSRRWDATGDSDCLFRAVTLFEKAEARLTDPAERLRLAGRAAIAVRLALDSGDPSAGLTFARFGLRLRPEDAWQTDHDAIRDATLDAAEAAYLCGDLAALEAFSSQAAGAARNGLDWVAANRNRLRQKLGAMEYEAALDIAVNMLARLDAPIPRRVNGAQVGAAFAATAWALKGRSMDDLFELPHMTDPRAEAELETLMFASSAAYFAQPNLFALIVFRMVRLSLAEGNSALSAFGWVCYGLAQCAVVGNFRSGHAFGQLALRLVEEFGAEDLRARIHMLFSVFVRQWSEGRTAVAAHLLQGEEAGIASGDLEFATYCTWHRINDGFWAGVPLDRIAPEVEDSRIVCLGYHQSKVAFLLG